MLSLNKYIKQISSSSMKMKLNHEEKKKLLELDKEYGELVLMYRNDFNTKDVANMDSEFEKFMRARNKGKKYFPQIKLVGKNGFYTDGILPRLRALLVEFKNFNCFLSPYYIELIYAMIRTVEFSFNPQEHYLWYTSYRKQTPSLENLEAARKMLNDNPYEEVDESDRNISGEEAAKIIQDYIDELGYGWKVKLNDNMIPRMNVDIDRTMNVKPSATFSETDIEGLKAHEVRGHIGRRYYGLKTGLNLFLMGLLWRNTLDEGLAIWNSLHQVEKVKPNVKFNIALKTIIAYYLDKKDFCELFDMVKQLAPNMPDKSIFATIVRFKRELQDCSLPGGNGDDMSYFCGYQIVKNMTDEQRDDILKYNIGPGQIADLPLIKLFFKYNKFKPLI